MTDYQLPASAVEAAANRMHDENWPSVHTIGPTGDPCSLCMRYAEQALRAAFDDLEMEEERAIVRVGSRQKRRFVSRWIPVEEPTTTERELSDQARKQKP